jgi:hypothetical protein
MLLLSGFLNRGVRTGKGEIYTDFHVWVRHYLRMLLYQNETCFYIRGKSFLLDPGGTKKAKSFHSLTTIFSQNIIYWVCENVVAWELFFSECCSQLSPFIFTYWSSLSIATLPTFPYSSLRTASGHHCNSLLKGFILSLPFATRENVTRNKLPPMVDWRCCSSSQMA